MKNYRKYEYNGPVLEFDRLLVDRWYGVTYATSGKKALTNLAYQFKQENNRAARSVIKLTGVLRVVKEEEQQNG